MRKLITILAIVLSGTAGAQKVQEIIRLDTIIDTRIPLQTEFDKVVSAAFSNEFWSYIPSWEESDTVLFIRLDLGTYRYDTIRAVIPGLTFKVRTPDAVAMAVSDKHVLLSFYGCLSVFTRNKDQLVFNKIFPLNETYSYYKLWNHKVLCGKAYDHHPMSEPSKTLLAVYDIEADAFTQDTEPAFSNIEFSHFGISHWIDASESKALFSQTTEYRIDLYDQKLTPAGQIVRKIKDWRQFDASTMARITKKVPVGSTKTLIDSLTPYENKVSRIEAAHFINDSLVLVRYIPSDPDKKNKYRKYDVWRHSKGGWMLVKSDLEDRLFDSSDVIAKSNFFITGGITTETFITGNRLVVIRAASPLPPFGKTFKKFIEHENNYYESNDPSAIVYVYKIALE